MIELEIQKRRKEDWWLVLYADYEPQYEAEWMEESELREWKKEQMGEDASEDDLAGYTVDDLRGLHREWEAETGRLTNGSEAVWKGYEVELRPLARAGLVRFIEEEFPGSSYVALEAFGAAGMKAMEEALNEPIEWKVVEV